MEPQQTTNERPFQCGKCSYKAKSSDNLRSHLHYIHIGTRCLWPGCYMQTSTEAGMRAHLKNAHCEPDTRQIRDGDHIRMKFACTWPGCSKTHFCHGNAIRCCHFHVYNIIQEQNAQRNSPPDGAQNRVEGETAHETQHDVDVEETEEMESEGDDQVEVKSEDASSESSSRSESDHEPEPEPDTNKNGDEKGLQMSKAIHMLESISIRIERHHDQFKARLDNLSRRVDELEAAIESVIHEGEEEKRARKRVKL